MEQTNKLEKLVPGKGSWIGLLLGVLATLGIQTGLAPGQVAQWTDAEFISAPMHPPAEPGEVWVKYNRWLVVAEVLAVTDNDGMPNYRYSREVTFYFDSEEDTIPKKEIWSYGPDLPEDWEMESMQAFIVDTFWAREKQKPQRDIAPPPEE